MPNDDVPEPNRPVNRRAFRDERSEPDALDDLPVLALMAVLAVAILLLIVSLFHALGAADWIGFVVGAIVVGVAFTPGQRALMRLLRRPGAR